MTGLLDLLTGALFCALGAVGFRTGRATHRPSAVLMIATGLAWLLGSVWPAATFLHRGPLVHLVTGYPNGRLRGRLPIMGVGLGYLDVIPAIGADQRATFVVGAVTILATAVGRRRAPAVERQARAVALIVGSVVMGVLIAGTLVRMATTAANPFVLTAYEAVLLGAAATLFADGTWGRPDRAALAGLTVDLGNRGGASIAEALATAMGDPTLRLATIDPSTGELSDESGATLTWPSEPEAGRTRTVIPASGPAVAVLDHAGPALTDRAILEPVTTLVGIAVSNARIQVDIGRRMLEIDASRRELVQAVDAERRSLERDLREGALGRLGDAVGMLALIPDDPLAPSAEIVTALHRATESVTEFARGVHPRSLDLGGLSTAIGELTGASPLAVSASLPAVRLPDDVELTLYFVAAEALTNAVKHASASRAAIVLEVADGLIRLNIADDGNGNGDLRAGGGLTGLADRLGVIGGALEIESVPGTGTTVIATVPGVGVDAAVGRWPVAR